jgi:DNA modification methylase
MIALSAIAAKLDCPHEVIGPCLLVCGDALEVERYIPAGFFACVSTDPPYGIDHPCNFHQRGRDKLARCNDYASVKGDDAPFDPTWILTLDVPSVLWGANHYSDKLPNSSGWLVWDKERPDDLDQATCELAWTNCVKGVRRFRHLWNGMMRASEHGENYHPTQKPVALYEWVLSLRWIPSGPIFDPYMGAGPGGIAAIRARRKFVGCELEPTHYATACDRIRREWETYQGGPLFSPKADPDLFGADPPGFNTARTA